MADARLISMSYSGLTDPLAGAARTQQVASALHSIGFRDSRKIKSFGSKEELPRFGNYRFSVFEHRKIKVRTSPLPGTQPSIDMGQRLLDIWPLFHGLVMPCAIAELR